jgi:CBS domain-containing protein
VNIGPLVTSRVLSIGPDRSLFDTARLMTDHKVGAAVVTTEDGRPGIITERDVLRAIADGADPGSTPVERYMTANAITASPAWDVTEAAHRMIDGGFRHLIVLDADGQVGGILSIRDLVRTLLDGDE